MDTKQPRTILPLCACLFTLIISALNPKVNKKSPVYEKIVNVVLFLTRHFMHFCCAFLTNNCGNYRLIYMKIPQSVAVSQQIEGFRRGKQALFPGNFVA
ncbi:hypothetical protein [Anaerotruncus massiliensis (ex Liu et al. 2021)]|uniref:hypothetical protein n=1 Tax=Anaerotruncus massiliensis (ex Liu et al. 2021) TaxID=2321404 RepID=UPI003AF8F667